MCEGGHGKNRETFLHIPDEPSKPRNFSPSKLLLFTVYTFKSTYFSGQLSIVKTCLVMINFLVSVTFYQQALYHMTKLPMDHIIKPSGFSGTNGIGIGLTTIN